MGAPVGWARPQNGHVTAPSPMFWAQNGHCFKAFLLVGPSEGGNAVDAMVLC
jgi:hypothetical protein